MNPLSTFIGFFIIFHITACTTVHVTPIKITTVIPTGGGNPEVNLNLCVQKTHDEKVKCLERIFPNTPSILLVPQTSGQRILLAGRGGSVERREITLKNDEMLLLNINTKNVKLPLSANVKITKESQNENSLVLALSVKDIKDNITLKDKEGNTVLDYSIIKK